MGKIRVVAFRFTTVHDEVLVELVEAGSLEEREFRDGIMYPGFQLLAEISVDVDADIWKIHQGLASLDEDSRVERFHSTLIEIGMKLVQKTG